MRRLALLLLAIAACRTGPKAAGPLVSLPQPTQPTVTLEELVSEVRTTILDSYRTLAGGYDEAYVDGIARDPRLVLIDVLPDAVVVGYDPQASRIRKIYPLAQLDVVSKALEVHVSRDRTVAWSFDALGYRVRRPGERAATLPLRATAVYEDRDGRWLKVLEHVSYPAHDDGDLVADDPSLAELPDDVAPGAEAVRDLIVSIVACDPKAQSAVQGLVVGDGAIEELRGADVAKGWCPKLLFAKPTGVALAGLRVQVSHSGTVAWAAANLSISVENARFGARATWVLEKQSDGSWLVQQTHVSAPITLEKLTAQVFGE